MGIEMQTPLYVKVTALVCGVLVVFVVAAWEKVNEWIIGAFKSAFRSQRTGGKRPLRPV